MLNDDIPVPHVAVMLVGNLQELDDDNKMLMLVVIVMCIIL